MMGVDECFHFGDGNEIVTTTLNCNGSTLTAGTSISFYEATVMLKVSMATGSHTHLIQLCCRIISNAIMIIGFPN